MSELEEKTDEFIEEFMNSPLVRRYLSVKEAYESDPHLNALKKEVWDGQKNLRNLSAEERDREFVRLRKIQKEIDEDSLTVTYNALKDRVEAELAPIRSLFQF
jgi:hypothetical protein